MFKLYKTWRRAKDMFVRPSIKMWFGKTWKSGPRIYLCGRKNLYKYAYNIKDSALIYSKDEEYTWGERKLSSKVYETSIHKLPNGLRTYDLMWKREVRKKLKKLHLGWIPVYITLPKWLRFDIDSWDVQWKTKYDEIRFEGCPIFRINMFGFTLQFTTHCPVKNEYSCDDHYWESILDYLYQEHPRNLKETIENVGIWHRLESDTWYFGTRPTYIKDDRLEEYFAATSNLKAKHLDKIIV